MNALRFNITLPFPIGNKLNSIKNKSLFIADSLREKFEREEQDRKNKKLEESYKASAKEDRALLREWDSVSGDGL